MKTVRVYTSATCARCDEQTIRDGAHPETAPEGWARVVVRVQSDFNRRSEEEEETLLCQSCWFALDHWLREAPPKESA